MGCLTGFGNEVEMRGSSLVFHFVFFLFSEINSEGSLGMRSGVVSR